MRKRLLAFAAIVIAIALIATVAVADKRRKTQALRSAHIAAWRCTHGRSACDEPRDEGRNRRIEAAWNYRERYYEAGVAAGVIGCILLVGLEVRSRRRPADQLS